MYDKEFLKFRSAFNRLYHCALINVLFQPPVCKNGENLVRKRRQVLDISDADYLLEERKETIQVDR